MDRKKRIISLLKKKIVILDGATGTELQKRGMPPGACPEAWCRENPDAIIAAIRREQPHVVGLSALMTTTMVNMKEVIALAAEEGLSCRFLVGGAVVTESYAASIGAAYAKDGVEAVRAAARLVAAAGENRAEGGGHGH